MKVLFLPEVVNQFLELAQVLYDEGYLGFKDAAIAYSEQLFRDIQTNLPLKVRKGAPAYFVNRTHPSQKYFWGSMVRFTHLQ